MCSINPKMHQNRFQPGLRKGELITLDPIPLPARRIWRSDFDAFGASLLPRQKFLAMPLNSPFRSYASQ